jgi:hypothetical protein
MTLAGRGAARVVGTVCWRADEQCRCVLQHPRRCSQPIDAPTTVTDRESSAAQGKAPKCIVRPDATLATADSLHSRLLASGGETEFSSLHRASARRSFQRRRHASWAAKVCPAACRGRRSRNSRRVWRHCVLILSLLLVSWQCPLRLTIRCDAEGTGPQGAPITILRKVILVVPLQLFGGPRTSIDIVDGASSVFLHFIWTPTLPDPIPLISSNKLLH